MLTTAIIYIAFALMNMLDSMLSSLVFIQKASVGFNAMFTYIDMFVYYLRSLMPLTISAIFTVMFQMFTVWVIFFFIRWIMRTVPFFGTN